MIYTTSRKRKRRIIVYDLVTRYGPRINCWRKRLMWKEDTGNSLEVDTLSSRQDFDSRPISKALLYKDTYICVTARYNV